MLILALETSTPTASVAIMETSFGGKDSLGGEKILGEFTLNLSGTHSERLMPAIDSLLRETSLSVGDIQGMALALGPGSFTALRIGASTVKGLVYGLKIPVVGVSTLEALAYNAPYSSTAICPVLDARKKEVYAALFRGDGSGKIIRTSEDWVVSPEELFRRISENTLFLGNGVEVYGDVFRENLGARASFGSPELSLPRALNVAKLSLPKFQRGETLNLFTFTPIYIRRSEAEIHYETKETN
ncbi:MAG: tRNA (adenosine(37)-N6)-threonylcarbamoyltransferase complex dimerization subunit type 1 TsaB [Thermodesulfobacteriota bacterium]|nr:tRNA (adenosine(37)-N6)-threonylcarbamoyltransferase complex dimerization subunit type 1 TsaB [Thermodesulfobacteriota bacterium]